MMKRISLLSILFTVLSSWLQGVNPYESYNQCSIAALPKSINDFGSDLTRKLGGNDNIFISPMSIYTALAMTYLGAKGRTAKEMEDSLQMTANGLDQGQLHENFRRMLDTITNSNDEYSLLLANAMFLQDNYAIKDSYENDIRTFYNAEVKLVDFENKGETAMNEINNFVAENTKNKLQNFLKGPLDRSTVIALINAIYFKGIWKIQFDEKKTRDGPFHRLNRSIKQVKFMVLTDEKFFYFHDRNSHYRFLELPYKGGDVSMLLALPNDYNQSPNLDMTSVLLCDILSQMRNITVERVQIPKFQLKYRKGLVSVLRQLGITDLFGNADLTGIADDRRLKVSNVIHEAVIDVNEQGSEAAAATGVTVVVTSISDNYFVADHPFTFYIIDKRNKLILFSGRVADP